MQILKFLTVLWSVTCGLQTAEQVLQQFSLLLTSWTWAGIVCLVQHSYN